MKPAVFLAVGMAIAVIAPAIADTPPKPAKAVMPTKMSCEEFLAVDEVTRPQIVFWSEGFNKKGKVKDTAIDIDRTNRLVPVLVEDCKMEPRASYWSKMKKRFDMD